MSHRIGRPPARDPIVSVTISFPTSLLTQFEAVYEQHLASRRTSARSLQLFIRDWIVWRMEEQVAAGQAPSPSAPPARTRLDAPALPGSAANHAWAAQAAPAPFPAPPSAPQGPVRSTAHIPPIVIAPGDRSFLPPPAAPGSIESVISPAAVEAFFNPRPGTDPDDSIEDMLPPSLRKPRQATPRLLESTEDASDVGEDVPKLPGLS